MPKKVNRGKADKISTKQLEYRLIELFNQNPTKPYNAGRLIGELNVANNKDSVEYVLSRLLDRGIIMPSKSGSSYVLFDAAFLSEEQNENPNKNYSKEVGRKRDDNIATGTVDMTRSGAAFIESSDSGLEKDIYIPASRMSNALHGDKVAVRWWKSSRGKAEGEITRIIERFAEQFIGTYTVTKNYAFVVPDNQNMAYDIVIERGKSLNAKDGDKVIVAVKKWHDPRRNNFSPIGEITTVLGESGSSDIEMQSILLENGFSLTFPEAVLRENEAIKEEIPQSEIDKREDFRHITTFTIDPLTAKDFDDALSYQELENGHIQIGVHIADVAHYVTPKSALDEEASKRTTSVYLVDRVLPMLPEKLSNGVCSLRPNEDKLTFSAVFEFTKDGELKNEWFGRTVIHSDRRFTYEEAQERIESKEGDFVKEILVMNEFAQKLRKERFKNGALGFESSEVQFVLDDTGKPIGIHTKIRKEAHFLVEEFMLLANKRVGTLITEASRKQKSEIPFVYRIHDSPDMEKVISFVQFAQVFGYEMKIKSPQSVASEFAKLSKEIEGKPEEDVLQQMAIRTMAKAAYSTKNIGHYGLAFENYSHFTSPIRRYSDVLAHRLLADFLAKKQSRITFEKLEETCEYISKKERKAMEAERASIKYKQVEFLQDHVGSVFQAVITGVTERGIYTLIMENHCEGLVSFDDMYDDFRVVDNFYIRSISGITHKMGDIVWVRVLSANLAKRQINMGLLEREEENDPQMLAVAKAQREQYLKKYPQPTAQELEEEEKEKAEVVVLDQHLKKEPNAILPLPEIDLNDIETLTPAKREKAIINDASLTDYEKIEKLYAMSHTRILAESNDAQWGYMISETPLYKGQTVFLEYNPTALKNRHYDFLTAHTEDIQAWKNSVTFQNSLQNLEDYLPEQDPKKVVNFYMCPYRTESEDQLDLMDFEQTWDLSMSILKRLQPARLISYSNALRDYMLENKLIVQMQQETVEAGKRKFTVVRGFFKIDEELVPIAFLPSLKVKIDKAVRGLAWSWAVMPFID